MIVGFMNMGFDLREDKVQTELHKHLTKGDFELEIKFNESQIELIIIDTATGASNTYNQILEKKLLVNSNYVTKESELLEDDIRVFMYLCNDKKGGS